MKIDFNYKFKTLKGDVIPEREDEIVKDKDGNVVKDKDGKETKKKSPDFILKTACTNVLLNPGATEIVCPRCKTQIKKPEELTGEEKARRFMLATKIYNGENPIDIGTKNIELLKDLIAKIYPSNLIVGQAWSILDPHEAEEKKKEI